MSFRFRTNQRGVEELDWPVCTVNGVNVNDMSVEQLRAEMQDHEKRRLPGPASMYRRLLNSKRAAVRKE